jgi:enoyl-CoA hydratase
VTLRICAGRLLPERRITGRRCKRDTTRRSLYHGAPDIEEADRSMDIIRVAEQDGVTVVTLDDGKANTIGRAMTRSLVETAGKLAAGSGGVAVTGAGRFFSAGLDLLEVGQMNRGELGEFIDRFEEACLAWFRLPRPVVAAINGHAIAGGAVMALAADVRLAALGDYRIGLTEVGLGIPFPRSALELVRLHLDPSRTGRALLGSELYGPEEAVPAGFADRTVRADALAAEACALARRLAAAPGRAYAMTKAALREPALHAFESGRQRQREEFLDCLTDRAVKTHIASTMATMKARKG